MTGKYEGEDRNKIQVGSEGKQESDGAKSKLGPKGETRWTGVQTECTKVQTKLRRGKSNINPNDLEYTGVVLK